MPEDLHTTQKRRISVHLCSVVDEDTVFGNDNLLPVFPPVERYALQTLRRERPGHCALLPVLRRWRVAVTANTGPAPSILVSTPSGSV